MFFSSRKRPISHGPRFEGRTRYRENRMSSKSATGYSLFANFGSREQVTNEGPMGTCSSFFAGTCGKAGNTQQLAIHT
jgi:hypothetical protein